MSTDWKVLLADQAELDLLEITIWTVEKFGDRQADEYTDTISLAIEALHDGPEILGVKGRDDIGLGICTFHVARNGRKGRHFVVFRSSAPYQVAGTAGDQTPPHGVLSADCAPDPWADHAGSARSLGGDLTQRQGATGELSPASHRSAF